MSEQEKLMSKKKPPFPVSNLFHRYLKEYNRNIKIPIFYEDLLRFQGCVSVYDENDEDTLWVRTYFSEFDREEIDISLKKIYTTFHSNGNEDSIPFLNVDAIDYCTFGNSKPFRIRIRNILNDNFTYFYVKKADASRIYGLELEHMLSPYQFNYLVYRDTLIEEHISGIPGDVFINEMLPKCSPSEKSQIAKEFVKFNERCMVRLLGDMRSYNYVIIPIHDFDHITYRIRAIDFDQQTFEGKFRVYYPQFFKENYPMVSLVSNRLEESSINQYKLEERSIVAKRMLSYDKRLTKLLYSMKNDTISFPENINQLKKELQDFTGDIEFKRCENMGDIVETALTFVKRNYLDISSKDLFYDN